MSACTACTHQHAVPAFGGICIGCPCPATAPASTAPAAPAGRAQCANCGRSASPAQTECWLHHAGPTISGAPLDVWVCPSCRILSHQPSGSRFYCDVCEDDEPCDACEDVA